MSVYLSEEKSIFRFTQRNSSAVLIFVVAVVVWSLNLVPSPAGKLKR